MPEGDSHARIAGAFWCRFSEPWNLEASNSHLPHTSYQELQGIQEHFSSCKHHFPKHRIAGLPPRRKESGTF